MSEHWGLRVTSCGLVSKDACADPQAYAYGAAARSGQTILPPSAITRIENMRRDRPPM